MLVDSATVSLIGRVMEYNGHRVITSLTYDKQRSDIIQQEIVTMRLFLPVSQLN